MSLKDWYPKHVYLIMAGYSKADLPSCICPLSETPLSFRAIKIGLLSPPHFLLAALYTVNMGRSSHHTLYPVAFLCSASLTDLSQSNLHINQYSITDTLSHS